MTTLQSCGKVATTSKFPYGLKDSVYVCTNFEDAFNLVENNTVIAINDTLRDDIIFNVSITINNITNNNITLQHNINNITLHKLNYVCSPANTCMCQMAEI